VRVHYSRVKISHHQGEGKGGGKQVKYLGRRIRVGKEIRGINMTKEKRDRKYE
jgi:hypothetical protein